MGIWDEIQKHNEHIDIHNDQMKQKWSNKEYNDIISRDFDISEFKSFSVKNVSILNEEAEKFHDIKITITFSTTRISMCTEILQKDFFTQDFPVGTQVDTEVIDINYPKQSVLRLTDSLYILMDTEDANRVKNYYDSINEQI